MTRRALGYADPTTYVANPLISFPLMRRMYSDVPKLLEFARQEIKGLTPQNNLANKLRTKMFLSRSSSKVG